MNDTTIAPTVSFGQAIWFWLKLGFISFDGPAMHNLSNAPPKESA